MRKSTERSACHSKGVRNFEKIPAHHASQLLIMGLIRLGRAALDQYRCHAGTG